MVTYKLVTKIATNEQLHAKKLNYQPLSIVYRPWTMVYYLNPKPHTSFTKDKAFYIYRVTTMKKQTLYLVLAIIGFILPTIFVIIESLETGNYLLYMDPMATMEGMFANRIAAIFMIDLLFAVVVFFVWSYQEARRYKIGRIWHVWLLTMLLGIAGGLPYFLYLREQKISNS